MNVARVLITPELLAQAMCFPEGTEIVSAGFRDDQDGRYVVLVVQHDGLQGVDDDERPPTVRPRFHRDETNLQPAVTFLDWGQDT